MFCIYLRRCESGSHLGGTLLPLQTVFQECAFETGSVCDVHCQQRSGATKQYDVTELSPLCIVSSGQPKGAAPDNAKAAKEQKAFDILVEACHAADKHLQRPIPTSLDQSRQISADPDRSQQQHQNIWRCLAAKNGLADPSTLRALQPLLPKGTLRKFIGRHSDTFEVMLLGRGDGPLSLGEEPCGHPGPEAIPTHHFQRWGPACKQTNTPSQTEGSRRCIYPSSIFF